MKNSLLPLNAATTLGVALALICIFNARSSKILSFQTDDHIHNEYKKLQWVLHDSSDNGCLEILKNCKKAMSKTVRGKLILVEMVLQPKGKGFFDDTTMRFDLLMMAHCSGGKERTQLEWIANAGFSSV